MARNSYSPEIREQAINRALEIGIRGAAKELGLNKTSVKNWIAKAGIDFDDQWHENTNKGREAAELQKKRLTAEANERATQRLIALREAAFDATEDMLSADGERMARRAGVKLSEVVGVWTRATHDLQLLSGEATERAERKTAQIDESIEAKILRWETVREEGSNVRALRPADSS